MPNYKITITPLQYYFFGGEKHDEEYKTNYFVESLDYPQQTTILGMLRYFLLWENNLLGGKALSRENQSKAKALIGSESFEYGEQLEFGKIKTLSPLFFTKEEKDYHFAPRDIHFTLDKNFQLYHKEIPYNAKDHYNKIGSHIISADGETISLHSIIRNVEQVGNEKAEKGGTKENAFYKQTMKSLLPGWSFAVYADMDLDIGSEDYTVQLGGEKCMFRMQFKKIENIPTVKYYEKHQRTQKSIVCISDCFVDATKIKELDFAVTDYVSFRNFRSKITTQNYYAFKKEQNINNGMVRSRRYQLLKRGSVLYFSDESDRDDFAKIIEADSAKNIGFNHILKN